MKKIYFIGDLLNNTGPAIVNKSYYPFLKNDVIFCFSNNKLFRSIHFLIRILFINNVIISGYSKLNILLLKISKLLNKKTFYLMHGFVKEEIKYQNVLHSDEKIKSEYEMLSRVSNIVCVSESFSKFLADTYPEFKNKIRFVNNGVDISIDKPRVDHDIFTIISVGGGKKRKNNLRICESIKKIGKPIRFIIIGDSAEEGSEIKKYSFVEYYESLSHDEVLDKMCESDLYIQNSYFETFGLAVMEALECGCNLLLSKNIGAISILDNLSDDDIIYDNDSLEEIIKKINKKLTEVECNISYDKNKCSCEHESNKILEMM